MYQGLGLGVTEQREQDSSQIGHRLNPSYWESILYWVVDNLVKSGQ